MNPEASIYTASIITAFIFFLYVSLKQLQQARDIRRIREIIESRYAGIGGIYHERKKRKE